MTPRISEAELAGASIVGPQNASGVGDGTSGWVYAFANGTEAVEVAYSDIPGPWTYHVEGRMVGGKPAITRLTIATRDPEKPGAITGRLSGGRRQEPSSDGSRAPYGQSGTTRSPTHAQARIQSVKAGRSWPAEHFVQVAWFAVDAELTDRAPRLVIQDQWGVSGITASRWLTPCPRTRLSAGLPVHTVCRPTRREPLRRRNSDP